ncbi:MAG: prepilin-type N-terminal cleavage/methylation domain-containing protein [Nitrospirae bacterium]|nr:prepilin-type N-terminal cleavage/methylation domain-containing protein [Nitrospirota bacterium]
MSWRRAWQPYVITDRRGMTLVELMVALTILSFAMVFILAIFMTQHRSYVVQEDVADTQSDARASLDLLTRDLRSAGFGISAGQTGITITNDSNPDSITFQVAQGPSTYLISPPVGSTITVANTPGNTFTVGNTVTLLGINSRSPIGGNYTVNAIAGTAITLNNAPVGAANGDLVLSPIVTIAYSVIPDPNVPNAFILQRTLNLTPAERLADHIQDLQFSYIMNDSTEVNTVAAANLKDIVMVRVTITSQTIIKDAETGVGVPRTRQLSTLVRLKNAAS